MPASARLRAAGACWKRGLPAVLGWEAPASLPAGPGCGTAGLGGSARPSALPRRPSAPRAAGISCNWAARHNESDALSWQHRGRLAGAGAAGAQGLEAGAQGLEADQPPLQPEQDAGPADCAASEAAPEAAAAVGNTWWWRGDGTVPTSVLELPVSATYRPAVNSLSKDNMFLLRWGP